jgi:hypothetical protein
MNRSYGEQKFDENQMQEIVEHYDTDRELCISKAYLDGGAIRPAGRLQRAALNQICEGEATVSRYAIWANTIRDNIILAEKEMGNENRSEARRLLFRAANSLSAFSEIQSHFDALKNE